MPAAQEHRSGEKPVGRADVCKNAQPAGNQLTPAAPEFSWMALVEPDSITLCFYCNFWTSSDVAGPHVTP